MKAMYKLYKVLDHEGEPCNGGTGKWFLPNNNRPGKWMPKIEKLVPCKNGYHLCRETDLLDWLGPVIYEAEYKGNCIVCDNKIVTGQARLIRQVKNWNERTARLFTCDCAERVLPLYKKQYPKDERATKAIAVARRFANGKATTDDLAAARAAAWAAAWAAAGDAAWSAARAAAEAAAEAAAGGAAGPAAEAAARDAEHKWQTQRLMHYLTVEIVKGK